MSIAFWVEKRSEPRVNMNLEKVVLEWRNDFGSLTRDFGSCIDLSSRGILFTCEHPFAINHEITVIFKYNTDLQQTVAGRVCRCTENVDCYYIAMQLD